MLVGIYEQLRQDNAALLPDDALAQARSDAGHLLAQGLMLVPKGDALFKTIAAAMLAASRQNFGGKYFPFSVRFALTKNVSMLAVGEITAALSKARGTYLVGVM
jgi:hypothetical protein